MLNRDPISADADLMGTEAHLIKSNRELMGSEPV
jgi:hypothetical protein